ncbi:hypothetical protein IMX26_04625 [Clostridium sp. 'deep sea']|uniref:NADH-ubiquinone oxidoreductase-F iron-sulfur binding region domain-containing protein n=1 Tax=Clostridium sp. 'deep sea' TaxID=2779445 RepID=UPI0018966174|nr:NADH-ubiquinone oxidoreductase-F iron-sulfur binding region domain-containing protein [Clostridium sp. 'deep sea']QOR36104.1 hypothetical protein IMX26_04625 [Clostridium sp. 'deep sea']
MQDKWLDITLNKLDKACSKQNDKTLLKFKTKSFRKVIKRVAQFSEQSCKKCTACRAGIYDCIEIISKYKGDRKEFKHYNTIIKNIVIHLKKVHGLIEEGYYMVMFFPLGMCLGVIVNVLYPDRVGYTLALAVGTGFGLSIGTLLDQVAKKKGRVI